MGIKFRRCEEGGLHFIRMITVSYAKSPGMIIFCWFAINHNFGYSCSLIVFVPHLNDLVWNRPMMQVNT